MEDLSTVEGSKESQAVGSSQEMPKPSRPSIARSALYLAVAEVFIVIGLWLNKRALLANLFGLGPEQNVMLNNAMGIVFAVILTALVTVDWTAQVLCLGSAFHILLISWMLMPSATCQTCPYLAPFLSMFTSTLEPIRLAFISDQLTTAGPTVTKTYFIFIAGSWFVGYIIVLFVTFFLEGPTMVPTVISTVLTIYILYTALLIFIQTSTQEKRARYHCRRVMWVVDKDYWTHEGNKYWDMLHIGISLTGHYAARLILNMALREQYRSIQCGGNLPGLAQSAIIALPEVLAVVIVTIMGFGVTPLLKRYNKEITDLQYIGLGMIFGCISMVFALVIQGYLDEELKPPRRQESLIFLFNLLPSATTFQSKVFGETDNEFIQVGGTSLTVFLARNVADEDEYPISVINLQEQMYEETFIKLIEGTTVSYFVTRGNFEYVSGLDLQTNHFIGTDSTFFLGCALNSSTCEGKEIEFQGKGWVHEDKLPPKSNFKVVLLPDGNYNISANVDGEVITLTDNFTTQSKNIHTGIVYEKEPGVPDIAIFFITKPQQFPTELHIFQQIALAFREAFFTVGLLRFLYYETPPNHPARPFVYSAFFFIYKGVPLIFIGGLKTSIFNFLEWFVVHVFLAYYACCTVLFINLANKYEHKTWLHNDVED